MRRYVCLLLLPLFLISCNRSGIGILYSISQEKPLGDTTLPSKSLTVSSLVKAADEYYVSSGAIFRRAADGQVETAWSDAIETPPSPYLFCTSLTFFGGKLYGIFSNDAGDLTALFSTAPDSIDWQQDASSITNRIVGLLAAGGAVYLSELIIVNDIAYTYTVHQSTDGTAFTAIPALTTLFSPVTDAAAFGTDTWLLSGSDLFYGSGVTFQKFSTTDGPSTVGGYGGVFYSATLGRLFVTNAEGKVFATADGLSWDTALIADAEEEPIPLYDIEEVSVAGTPVIVVGAKNGYYDIIFANGAYESPFSLQIPGSDETLYTSSDANYLKIDLRASVVRFFFVDNDGADQVLFACTAGNGLWINPLSGMDLASSVRKWDRQ